MAGLSMPGMPDHRLHAQHKRGNPPTRAISGRGPFAAGRHVTRGGGKP